MTLSEITLKDEQLALQQGEKESMIKDPHS